MLWEVAQYSPALRPQTVAHLAGLIAEKLPTPLPVAEPPGGDITLVGVGLQSRLLADWWSPWASSVLRAVDKEMKETTCSCSLWVLLLWGINKGCSVVQHPQPEGSWGSLAKGSQFPSGSDRRRPAGGVTLAQLICYRRFQVGTQGCGTVV